MKRALLGTMVITLGIVVAGGWFVNRELQAFLAIGENTNTNGTNTAAEDQNSWQFAVIGDTEDMHTITQTMIDDLATRDIAFVIHVGDIASHGDPNKMREVAAVFNTLPVSTYYVPGNNDLIYDETTERKTLKNYTEVFGNATYQSFDYNNAHFILLNNSYLRDGFPDAELTWLEDDLANNTKPFTFVFFHRPLHLPGEALFGDDETPHSREQNEKFLRLIAQFNITHIYNGHIHIPVSYQLGDQAIPVTVTGGGGAYPQDILGGPDAAYFHYTLVTVGDENTTPTEERISFGE